MISMVRTTVARGVTALFALALLAVATEAQTPDIPRTPTGRPDFNGVWQALGNAHWNIEPHAASAGLQMQPGPVIPVPANEVVNMGTLASVPSHWGVVEGGVIPYTADALARRNENRENWVTRDPEVKCYLPGVPRANYMPYPFQIFQSESHFFMAYEYAGAVRNVYLEDPGPPQVDSWMGQSVGHWEGDTFVVVANGFNDQTWFDRAGNHHSYAMIVTERYTPVSDNILQYQATIDDPMTFSRPWTIEMPLYRNIEDDAQLFEFNCVEYAEELLYGDLESE